METSTDQQPNQNVPDDTKPPITGCAHYKRKSKFVVSGKILYSSKKIVIYFRYRKFNRFS